MYCCHCGKEIDENRLEDKKMSQTMMEGKIDENTTIEYVCPRCGHLIHKDVTNQEIKTLAAASHAEIQKGRNAFSNGMALNCVGVILLVLAIIFFLLAKKPAQNYQLITTCPEFFVSMVGFAVGGVLLILGIVFTTIGLITKGKYQKLLDDIQDDVFHQ